MGPAREKAEKCLLKCSSASSSPAIQHSCARRCQETLATLQEVFAMHWNPFVGELSRCVDGCYHSVVSSAPPEGDPAVEQELQTRYEACCKGCGDKVQAFVPELRKGLVRDMQEAVNQ